MVWAPRDEGRGGAGGGVKAKLTNAYVLGFPLEYSKHSKWALAYFACGIFRCSRRNIPENRRNISKTKCMPTNRKVRRSKYSTRALFKSEYSSEVRGSPSGFVREHKRSYHHARAH